MTQMAATNTHRLGAVPPLSLGSSLLLRYRQISFRPRYAGKAAKLFFILPAVLWKEIPGDCPHLRCVWVLGRVFLMGFLAYGA